MARPGARPWRRLHQRRAAHLPEAVHQGRRFLGVGRARRSVPELLGVLVRPAPVQTPRCRAHRSGGRGLGKLGKADVVVKRRRTECPASIRSVFRSRPRAASARGVGGWWWAHVGI